MVGTFVAIGWRDSPWVPLGVSAAVAVMLVAARWRTRRGRRMLEADRAEGRRVLNAHAARVGHAMVRIAAVWIACSILLVIVLLGSRL